MKTIGLLGGMSWESTLDYYRRINRCVNRALGGLHSAELVLYSVDFEPLERAQHAGDWDQVGEMLALAAHRVVLAGADFLVLCTNTMHKVSPHIEAAIDIPLVHIADATGEALEREGIATVGLLGTAFTMQEAFYRERLQQSFGLQVLVPSPRDQQAVHRVIYEELCHGQVLPQSRERYLDIVQALARDGAEAVILGCTEIGLLVAQQDTDIALFDTTALHATKAVELALQG